LSGFVGEQGIETAKNFETIIGIESLQIFGPSSNSSDGSGSKNFDPGWVSHLWFGFEFGKFPLKMSNVSIFFPSDQKKISSGQVEK